MSANNITVGGVEGVISFRRAMIPGRVSAGVIVFPGSIGSGVILPSSTG